MQATAGVPTEFVSLKGCTPAFCAHFAPKLYVIRRQFFDEAGTPGLDSLLYRRSSCFPMAHVDF